MKLVSILIAVALAAMTSGCAIGVKQQYDGARSEVAAQSNMVTLGVLDHRPYVRDKTKFETFTGLSRGGYGNPFDVSTTSGQPLAVDMAKALEASLAAKGTKVTVVTLPPEMSQADAQRRVATPGGKGFLLVLTEWKSDTYVNTALHYDIEGFVIDPNGSAIARNKLSGTDNLGGGLDVRDTAPVKAFGQKMQQLLSTPPIGGAL